MVSKLKTYECNIPIYSNGIQNNGLYGYTNKADVYENSITISARGTIGYVFVRTEPYHPIVRLISVIPYSLLNLNYLMIFLNTMREIGNGSNTPQLTVPDIKTKLIALPPLKEQNRIVNILKIVLEKIDLINNEKKRIKDLIVILKKQILNLIFDDNSSYKSYYNDKYNTTLKQMIPKNKIGDGDWVLTSDMDENGEYSLVQLKHICEGKYNKEKKYNHINSMFFKNNNCSEIKENYILINRLIMSSMNVCILPKLGFKTITSVDVCWIAPDNSYNQKYLMYYLLSSSFQNQVLNKSSGSTRKRISKKNLINIPMRIHNIKDQEIIVKKIDAMFEILNLIIS